MRICKFLCAIVMVTAIAIPVFAQDGITKFTFGENQYLELHYLLQIQGYSTQTKNQYFENNVWNTDSYWSKDFKIRRSRVILKGQAAQGVEFFMETDAPNFEDNNNGKNLFTQDAYIDFTIAKEFKIAFGHILLPFMHHDRQSAATLLCVDYTGAVVPVGGNVWRDTGIEFRGLLFGGIIDYRIGAFDGVDRLRKTYTDTFTGLTKNYKINNSDMPRITGRIQINLKDPEEGFFYSGNYLGKKSIISFGGGIDYQSGAYDDKKMYLFDIATPGNSISIPKASNYFAWTVDAYLDHPIGANNALTLQAAYINVKNSPFSKTKYYYYDSQTSEYNIQKASMYFVEGGFLFNGIIQPVARFYYKKAENKYVTATTAGYWTTTLGTNEGIKTASATTMEVAGGVNYFIKGHNANIKVEYAQELKDETSYSTEKKITVQCQILI